MVAEIIPPGDEPRHLVDVQDLPHNALSAILRKLNEKSQKSTQSFFGDYKLNIYDIKNLLDKVSQEFNDVQPISETTSVSIHLSSNRRFYFSSWEEFKEFDSTQTETTKSISVEYTLDFISPKQNLERYKIQVSIQNIPARYQLYIGPITLGPVEDIGIPPVPIHATVQYSNYIRGKNIISTVDGWVNSLEKQDRKIIDRLQKWSHSISKTTLALVTLSAMIGCLSFVPPISANISDACYFILYCSIFIYCSYKVGGILSAFLERFIDMQTRNYAICLTRGDENASRKLEIKNRDYIRNSFIILAGIITQITCSITASYIWEIAK
ncbi:hypothetical protein [Brucella pituitosa]|uniref:Uncharacterized protein n=1 Tax=Brucella pituitosa TaxID=571256 RepID=A0ABS3JVK6_9HYPH|nr:hypothetical protein [Brucella pituitosa]MBO1038694.1 hypothetical protein [Brucella pituitosa]